ncbi:putative mitochondrial protein [Cucumis melo var. makuwa]|uniref:Mitochondrial protein n=1 Tax=Cucumis melo var. makuwa TaxID=1194695 RepID=A0A5A7VNE2_CUCMM|nr:putative mitochondrial protein [Cucumis melo var. makuwa]
MTFEHDQLVVAPYNPSSDDNGTWDLVSRPVGKKAIGCKWVFSVKVNLDGTMAQLKARLVAKGKFGAKPSGTPMMPNQELVKEEQLCKDPERYRRLVGKLNFLTVTRPDITYSISVASQFMSSPTLDHWATVEKILCYLKATLGNDRRSTSGYYVFVGKNLVSWKIALHIASNPVFHERTKHIEVDCHFIHEKIQDGLVSIGYVKTEEQLGDVLTKVVNAARISYLCNKLDMIGIFAPA